MRAVTIEDGALHWREHPDPVPGPGDLLVAVRAAGLNAADLVQRAGFYPAPPGSPPDIPGLELAGEVLAVGEGVTTVAPGARVMAVVGGGAQAELALVDEAAALAVPEGMAWAEAGGFPEAFATAHDALVTQCSMASGDRVLVTGAAGGVGTAGVQLAAAVGAHAVASVRRRELHGAVAALGAEVVAAPDEVPAHGPFDVALELVGAASFADVIGSMAEGGRVAVIGVSSGGAATLDLMTIMRRRLRVSGSTLRARSRADKAAVAAGVRQTVLPLLAAGSVRVPVASTVPLERAPDAYDRFAAGGKLGKIVLVTGGD